MFKRKNTYKVNVGGITIGGSDKIVIQSMTNTKTHDVKATIEQINKLVSEGCEIVRVAVFDNDDSKALEEIVKLSPCPIVADIHFNHEFAINAILAGVAKVRLNPGNIKEKKHLVEIIKLAKKHKTAIRIGVNSGSIPEDILTKYGVNEKSMILTAKRYLKVFEEMNFKNIILSLKCSDPILSIKSYRAASKIFPYPLHLGITESGSYFNGTIKSCAGLAPLLVDGIGNTIRISIVGNPVNEIKVCKRLLASLGLYNDLVQVIACPTCGRLNFNLEEVVEEVEDYVKNLNFPLKISILGCVVNGIGEGKESDIGIAGSYEKGIIFEKGKILKTVPEKDLIHELKILIDKHYKEFLKKTKK